MTNGTAAADTELLHLLADTGPLTVADIMRHLGVTRTAVHERLLRSLAEGLVGRELVRGGRGRPSYRYSLNPKARELSGNNFADLAAVLWRHVFGNTDSRRRSQVLRNIAGTLKALYVDAIRGTTLAARMASLRELLEKRRVRCEVDAQEGAPTLTLRDCPYPGLAADGSICRMEAMLLSQLLGDEVVLARRRRDGHAYCQFAPNQKRVQKGVRHRCRNGPKGAAHNGA